VRLHKLYKMLILLTVCYSYTYSMTYSSGFVIIIQDNMIFSVISWHQMDTRLGLDPACNGDPAYIWDPASIRTNGPDPWLVMGTRLLFETRLVLEVLRYTDTKCRIREGKLGSRIPPPADYEVYGRLLVKKVWCICLRALWFKFIHNITLYSGILN